jgi:hypothetical protein
VAPFLQKVPAHGKKRMPFWKKEAPLNQILPKIEVEAVPGSLGALLVHHFTMMVHQTST